MAVIYLRRGGCDYDFLCREPLIFIDRLQRAGMKKILNTKHIILYSTWGQMWYCAVGGHDWFFVCIISIIYLQSHTHIQPRSGHSGKEEENTHTLRHNDDGGIAPTAPNSESAFHLEWWWLINGVKKLPGCSGTFGAPGGRSKWRRKVKVLVESEWIRMSAAPSE